MSEKKGIWSYRPEVWVIGLLMALWAIAGCLSLFGISQLKRIEDELRLIGEGSTRLAQSVSRIAIGQFQSSVYMEHQLGLLDESLARSILHIRGSIDANTHLAEQEREIRNLRAILTGMARDSADAWHQAGFNQALKLVEVLATEYSAYINLTAPLLKPDSREIVRANPGFALRLEQVDTRLDDVTRQISQATTMLIKESVEFTNQLKRTTLIEMEIVAALTLLLGLALVMLIIKLQKLLVQTENLALIGKMTVTLRHEINNPLAAIIGNSYLLRHGKLSSEQQKETVTAIEQSAQRISTVVKRLSEMKEIISTDYVGGVQMLDLSDPKSKS